MVFWGKALFSPTKGLWVRERKGGCRVWPAKSGRINQLLRLDGLDLNVDFLIPPRECWIVMVSGGSNPFPMAKVRLLQILQNGEWGRSGTWRKVRFLCFFFRSPTIHHCCNSKTSYPHRGQHQSLVRLSQSPSPSPKHLYDSEVQPWWVWRAPEAVRQETGSPLMLDEALEAIFPALLQYKSSWAEGWKWGSPVNPGLCLCMAGKQVAWRLLAKGRVSWRNPSTWKSWRTGCTSTWRSATTYR